VHHGTIIVNNQTEHNSFFCLFISILTCFKQPCAHHKASQLYQYDIWYMSLCTGDHLVCRLGSIYTRRSPV